jgi:hypothetical protein
LAVALIFDGLVSLISLPLSPTLVSLTLKFIRWLRPSET